MSEAKRKAYAIKNCVNKGELEAIRYILTHIQNEGALSLHNVCKSLAISRVKFVVALKILAATEIIKEQSLGRCGTYIKVIDQETAAFLL